MRQNLFSNFSPVTKSEWQEHVRKNHQMDPKALIWDTLEGFEADPYHDSTSTKNRRDPLFQHEKVTQIRLVGVPDDFVNDSGNSTGRNADSSEQPFQGGAATNSVSESLSGSDSDKESIPLLYADAQYHSGTDQWEYSGFPVTDPFAVKQWFIETNTLNSRVFIDFGAAEPVHYSALRKMGAEFENISLLYDPFTQFLKAESRAFDHETVLNLLPEMVNPRGHSFCVDGSFYAKAGATIVEQVAFITAVLSEIFSVLSQDERETAADGMLVRCSGGPLYFPEMAKLRALRILWANVLKAYGLSSNHTLEIITETSTLYKTERNAENNLIRNTAEAMASVAGGTNYLLIHPHDGPFTESDTFSRRMADNLFHILKEEAFADAVSDPAAGSYYIENLTDTIAEEAWALFQEIESEGGFMEAIKKGLIQKRIKESSEGRKSHIDLGEQ